MLDRVGYQCNASFDCHLIRKEICIPASFGIQFEKARCIIEEERISLTHGTSLIMVNNIEYLWLQF